MYKKTPKIIFKKNPDGTTTKVVVKKVVKKVKISTASQNKSKFQSSPSPQNRNSSFNKPTYKKDSHQGGKKKILITKKKKTKQTGSGFASFDFASNKGRDYSSRKDKREILEKDKLESKEEYNKYTHTVGKNQNTTFDEYSGIPKNIEIPDVISIKDLALKLNLKASQILKKLFNYGIMDLTVNDNIDAQSAQVVCAELNCNVKVVSLLEQSKVEEDIGKKEDYEKRDPVVTIMGHVDHGKTTLLETIKKSKLTGLESGGITQHIEVYHVQTSKGGILFIDTPGHAAFFKMRARSTIVTDLIILVVSAVDGIKPQTTEVIEHAKKANVNVVVAVNKMDMQGADFKKIELEFSKHGLSSTDKGGDIIFHPISALKNQGIDELLEKAVVKANTLSLKGNKKVRASGYVIESKVETGKGNVATVVIKNGLLKEGDAYICGNYPGRVRAMFDERGKIIKKAGPSSVVEVIGLDGFVSSGDQFQVLKTEKEARKISEMRIQLEKTKSSNVKKVTLSNLFDTIKETEINELKVIVKGDVFGSVEAIKEMLEKMKNEEVKISVIHFGTGSVTENDINLASASNALILGFKVRPNSKAKKLAELEGIKIYLYQVVYDLVDQITKILEGMLKYDHKEDILGQVKVKEIYKISGSGKIVGCIVTKGKIIKNGKIRVLRSNKNIFEGDISSLKRFKDNVKHVSEGMECGIQIKSYQDYQVGDVLESYSITKVQKKLQLNVNNN